MSKVLLTWQATDDELERFRAALPEGTTVVAQPRSSSLSRFDATYESIADQARDADAIVAFVLPEGILNIAKNLKLICWMHAGLGVSARDNKLNFDILRERGIKVTNLRGANSVPVAEQAMTLMLGLAKHVLANHQAVQDGLMVPYLEDGHRGAMLEGRTLAVVGLGNIGTGVAKRAKAFDMRVIGVRRHPERGGDHVDAVSDPSDLVSVIKESDFIVIAAPITRETDRLIGKAEIAAMKPTAFLINVSRANVVDENSLHQALVEKRIAGFASDAWWHYPESYPGTSSRSMTGVHRLPNVLTSSDQSHNTDGYLDRVFPRAVQSLSEFLDNKPLTWEASLDLRY